MKSLTLRYPVLLIIIIAVMSRIPLMLGPHYFLDGDECLEGLMSRMMIESGGLWLFPWGQNYGFSLIETGAIIPFYLVMGYTTLAVKLGVFSVWIAGVIMLYKTFCLLSEGKTTAFLLALLFVLFPAWNMMSMKAYGGYITAFTLSNVLLYLLVNGNVKRTWVYYAAIGFLLVLIAESQRLWLVGVLPFVMYTLLKDRKWKESGIAIFTATATFLFFYYYKQDIQIAYRPSITLPATEKIAWYITRFPEYLYSSLRGDYYFNQYGAASPFSAAYAGIGTVIFFVLFLMGIYQFLFVRKKNVLFVVSTMFIPLCFVYTFFTYTMEGRYLLPLSGYLFVAMSVLLKGYKPLKIVKAAAGIIAVTGIGSCISFYNFYENSKEYKKSVLTTISYLQAQDVRYTYSTDCMLPFQIIFYSDTKIMSRMPFQPARYQPYSDAVDSALNCRTKIAVLKYRNLTLDMTCNYANITPEIAVCINPPITEIWKGFDFYHPKAPN